MSQEGIKGSGRDYYKKMKPGDYEGKVNTPSASKEYFERFHHPLIERAKQQFGTPIRLLDIACGPANELDFLKNDPDVHIVATDISAEILEKIRSRFGSKDLLFASDVAKPALKKSSMDAGIMVNAMIYVPEKMLAEMYEALKSGAECVVNITPFEGKNSRNPDNPYILRGRKIFDRSVTVHAGSNAEVFHMTVLDYSAYNQTDGTPDLGLRQLGQQAFFKSTEDFEKLIKLTGFEVVEHTKFQFLATENQTMEDDVYTLRKPAGA